MRSTVRYLSAAVQVTLLLAGTLALSPLRNLTLNLRDDCLRLGKPVQML